MNTENNNQAVDLSTETKIKNAARVVFHKKGFAATRTRDIAEEANINLALLNYYFRSKEKLFDIVMLETMQGFFRSIADVFNDETTSFEGKIDVLVATYIDLLIANPDIPLFIFHELRTQSGELIEKLGAKQIIMKSSFFKQFQQSIKDGTIPPLHPMHFIMNLMGMIVFPFVVSPLLRGIGDVTHEQFNALMQQRKALIPVWMKAILHAEIPNIENKS